MRTAFMFPVGERADTVSLLDRHFPEQRYPWLMDRALYVDIDDERDGHLFSDWPPEEVTVLDAALGHHPAWAVQIGVPGRVEGTTELHHLAELLLAHGGVAMDNYSDHPWTLEEIRSGAVKDGLHFFDFRTFHELNPFT
ncbi:hypothetical protein [Actinomadura harenae]|uniref:Uncharacterized protein n=1 Tax=Actinomadura harenae TaxID=2483351 RepID=A0A3M2LQD6_9ACTN|nr:hypothetical protein [Actinomadura harenae]RMI38295.1 hypothetical protein EBO15_33225 [Actinomadura harenae]